MRKTYKYRLHPTKNQTQKLEQTLETCRILYNSCLQDRRNRYEQTGKGLSRIEQQKILVADKKRVQLLLDVHSQVLQDVLFRVEKAYQGFFRRLKENTKPGYPRFKGEGRYDSITYPQKPGFDIVNGRLKLSKIGHIKIKLHRQIRGDIKTCTVMKDGNHWYACFSVEYNPDGKPVPIKSIGIDVGVKSFAVLSDGTIIDNPRYLTKSEKKLIRKQKDLSRKKKGSSNRMKTRLTVASLHRKVKNQRSDFQHKVSRYIVDNYGFIAVEDLNIRNMVRNCHLAKSISDAGWGGFLLKLAYKAEEAGCRFEKVTARNTSVICSGCGENVPKNLSVRTHMCPFCGLVLDRDHNAAINIINKSTVGITGSNARGEAVQSGSSWNREAPSERAE